MEVALELLRRLAQNDKMMWVVGGVGVVSENDSKGIKEPEVSGGYVTMEADNWHFHLGLESITAIQFVEAESHGDLMSYYVRFSNDGDGKEETLVALCVLFQQCHRLGGGNSICLLLVGPLGRQPA